MINRRRFIGITAAAAGLPLLPFASASAATTGLTGWQGTALGARSEILLNLHEQDQAKDIFTKLRQETDRLEQIFSLYQGHSAISRLNRDGYLDNPPPELVLVLQEAHRVSQLTGGMFDVTVQPLWQLHEEFGHHGPFQASKYLADVLALVDFRAIQLNADRIAFTKRGMAITLNGIAQGFITDRITALLRREGLDNCLVQMGEIRALGHHISGRPWQIGIDGTDNKLALENRAMATSHAGQSGHKQHIFRPTGNGASQAPVWRQMTVLADSAMRADAFSTAFMLMEDKAIQEVKKLRPELTIFALSETGQQTREL